MTQSAPFLAYGRQSITQNDIEAVIAALKSDFLTTGPLVAQFEAAIAAAVGAREAVVVSNGTAALHLALLAMDLEPHDVVIVPSITFVASANAVAYCGAKVVFADIDPLTGLMSNDSFDEALAYIQSYPNLRFAGVIPVHYAGRPVDLSYIAKRTKDLGGFILEDACHALGSVGRQGRIGACSQTDMACFSFHPVKTITTGEGGAITLNDPFIAQKLRQLRSHGIERDPQHFMGLGFGDEHDTAPYVHEMQALGYNYRLPDINCALGLSQLARLPQFLERRARLINLYSDLLPGYGMDVHWQRPEVGEICAFHLFAIVLGEGLNISKSDIMVGLKQRGIGSQVHYMPVHRQPFWQTHQLFKRPLPQADSYYCQTLSLPLYPDMEDGDPKRVLDALAEIVS